MIITSSSSAMLRERAWQTDWISRKLESRHLHLWWEYREFRSMTRTFKSRRRTATQVLPIQANSFTVNACWTRRTLWIVLVETKIGRCTKT